MKIGNDGKPNYGPRSRGKKQPDGGGDWLFWLGLLILVLAVAATL